MKFLFEAITLQGPDHFFYRVYQHSTNGYFAELMDSDVPGWSFHQTPDGWKAEDEYFQYQAEQLGEEVDRKGH